MVAVQDTFNVRRELDGRVRITVTAPIMLVPPEIALQIGRALFEICGGEVVFADPGQTVIAPPKARLVGNGNGHG